MIPALTVLALSAVIWWQRDEIRRLARENDYLRRALLQAQSLAGLR